MNLQLPAGFLQLLGALKHRAAQAERELEQRLLPGGEDAALETDFLPDFCRGELVFNVAVVAELLALVITLVMPRDFLTPSAGQDLLVISLFVQWVALGGTATLCYTRRLLNRLPRLRALVAAFLLLLAVTFLVSELALWLLWGMGKVSSPHPEWYANFHVLTLTLSALVNGMLLRLFLAKHALTRHIAAEAHAKLLALQSRIRPHFVFNSLNIIAALTRSAPEKAEAALEDIADLFRMMLSQDDMLVPVRNEIDVTKKYIALETLRLDNRLRVEWDVGTFPRKAAIPVLTLQPLLENAIRHGIESLPEGGTVRVRLQEMNGRIHIEVTNPRPAVRARTARDVPGQSLADIRQRLRAQYGDAALLHTQEEIGRYTVTVVLPLRGGDA
ncbi:MAG: histidine kinase [Gammaproteobacteria bacterium]|nr:histidine kinase [Gammaproteobacteria bacterium]